MPVTFAHPAGVLFFRKTRLPWSALVIGSIGPDFQYFLRVSDAQRSWHFFPDVAVFCFPFTIAAFYAFQFLLKEPLYDLLPVSLQCRIRLNPSRVYTSQSGGILALLALALGISTHVIWDAFTHSNSWAWTLVSPLRQRVWISESHSLYGFQIAQAASSVLGLTCFVVFLSLLFLKRGGQARAADPSPRRKVITAMLLIGIAVTGALRTHPIMETPPGKLPAFRLTMLGISISAWLMWEILAYAAVMRLLGPQNSHPG